MPWFSLLSMLMGFPGYTSYYLEKWNASCLVMVERLFLAVPRGCLQFVIVVFPDHTHLLFSLCILEQSL